MQTTFYDSLQGLQQSLQNLKSQANFSDPELSNKFSALVDSLMSFAEESTTSVNEVATSTPVAVQPEEVRTTSDHLSNKVTVASAPIANKLVHQSAGTSSFLLNDPYQSEPFKPTDFEFSQQSGLSLSESSRLISAASSYGHDYRNWAGIMSSGDPVSALRKANNAVYNSDLNHTPYARSEQYMPEKDVVAANGNFAIVEGQNGYKRLMLVAKDGLMLTQAGTHEDQIRANIERFGFNASEIAPLIAKVEQFDDVLAEEMRRALG
jgi:hypothetical protein